MYLARSLHVSSRDFIGHVGAGNHVNFLSFLRLQNRLAILVSNYAFQFIVQSIALLLQSAYHRETVYVFHRRKFVRLLFFGGSDFVGQIELARYFLVFLVSVHADAVFEILLMLLNLLGYCHLTEQSI